MPGLPSKSDNHTRKACAADESPLEKPRPLFLVTKIRPATAEETAAIPEAAKPGPEVALPPEKQRALLLEGATVQAAPLWEPNGGTLSCKVVLLRAAKDVGF